MDFEEYLNNKYIEENQVIDDVIPDDFNEWLANLETDEWINLGNKFARKISKK